MDNRIKYHRLAEGVRVSYRNQYRTRTGTIIEMSADRERARVKWDGRKKMRTWIRSHALALVPGNLSQ